MVPEAVRIAIVIELGIWVRYQLLFAHGLLRALLASAAIASTSPPASGRGASIAGAGALRLGAA